jgi:hypothetical protein
VKLFHGVSPPEPKDRKEAMLGPFVNADESYIRYLTVCPATFPPSEVYKLKISVVDPE